MTTSPSGPVAAAASGVAIGVVQWAIVGSGMRAVAASQGLAGIGTGADYALMVAGVTALLLAIVTAVLRLRLWGLAALSAGLVELCLAMVVWPFAHRIGLAGDSSALLCIPLACVATALVGSRWPART